MVPTAVAASTSPVVWPDPVNVPFNMSALLSTTVAPVSVVLSGSDTEALPDTVASAPSSVHDAVVRPNSVGGSLTLVMPTVVVTGVLDAPTWSVTTQLMLRVGLEPKSVGFSPA